jgi:hypothetical protein
MYVMLGGVSSNKKTCWIWDDSLPAGSLMVQAMAISVMHAGSEVRVSIAALKVKEAVGAQLSLTTHESSQQSVG